MIISESDAKYLPFFQVRGEVEIIYLVQVTPVHLTFSKRMQFLP